MAIDLPQAIAAYFAADGRDGDAVARCFTERATVKDEAHTYTGREAIRQWWAYSSARYNYISEPFAIATEDGVTTVTSHLAGDFPGSPVDLRYVFQLEGEKISSLKITP
jgi:hypothetical protein